MATRLRKRWPAQRTHNAGAMPHNTQHKHAKAQHSTHPQGDFYTFPHSGGWLHISSPNSRMPQHSSSPVIFTHGLKGQTQASQGTVGYLQWTHYGTEMRHFHRFCEKPS